MLTSDDRSRFLIEKQRNTIANDSDSYQVDNALASAPDPRMVIRFGLDNLMSDINTLLETKKCPEDDEDYFESQAVNNFKTI